MLQLDVSIARGKTVSTNIPIELLRTFAGVVDTGSMVRAAERLNLTPSAVSLQIKRLEGIVGTTIFYRETRQLVLNRAGELLLQHARTILAANDQAVSAMLGERAAGPVRVGVIQDFAETPLTDALSAYANANPDAQINLKVAGSQELRDLVAANRLDLAFYVGEPDRAEAITLRETAWLGRENLFARDVLPLALLEPPCWFREQAIQILNETGRKYEIMVETSSVSALLSSVRSGLGVTMRIAGLLGANGIDVARCVIPKPKSAAYCLAVNELLTPGMKQFERILRRVLESY